jgi:long-chain acyl-CoA synthetase
MLYKLLAKQARISGHKTAIIGDARSLSFAELFEKASNTAAYLQTQGCKAGDPIIIGIPPSPEFYVAFHAAAALGLVILPLLPSGRIPQLVIERKPTVAIGDQKFLQEATRLCETLRHCITWTRDYGLETPASGARFKRTKIFHSDCAIGVSSSGTTGTPTIYYRSQELLVRRAELRVEALGLKDSDILLSTRPFNSGSSINSHVVTPLAAGCKVIVQERFKRFAAADVIGREKVTVLYAVPYIFELLASIPVKYPVDFSSLRLCISGGAPLAESVANSFLTRFHIELRQLYGGSHIHPAFTCNLGEVRGAVGQAFGPFPIVILGENESIQKPDMIGEIAFDYSRSAKRWKKYLKDNPNRRGRYIYTGDLGRSDRDGNVFIVGQKSTFIKVRGNRVEPAEVEAVLRSHSAVQEAFVYPVDRGLPGEAVAAVVVGHSITESDLVRHCAQKLDGYKCPRKIEIRSSLPRNAQGKLARKLLEDEVGQGAATATSVDTA